MGAKPSSTNVADQENLWLSWIKALNDPGKRNKVKVGDLNPDMLRFVGTPADIANYEQLKPMPPTTLVYAAPPAQQDARFLLGLVYNAVLGIHSQHLRQNHPGVARKILSFVTNELFTQATFGEAFDKFQAFLIPLRGEPLFDRSWHYKSRDAMDKIYSRAAELAVEFQANQQAPVLHAAMDASLEGSCLRGLKDAENTKAEHCIEFEEARDMYDDYASWASDYNETRWQYTIDPVHIGRMGQALSIYFYTFFDGTPPLNAVVRKILADANFYSILENMIEVGPLNQPRGGGGRLRPFLAKYDMMKFVTPSKPNNPRSQLIDTKDWLSNGSTVRNPVVLLAWLCIVQQCDGVQDSAHMITRFTSFLQVSSSPNELWNFHHANMTEDFAKAIEKNPQWVARISSKTMMNLHAMWNLVESSMDALSPEEQADVARAEWKGIAHEKALVNWRANEKKRAELIAVKRNAFATQQYMPMLQAWFALRDAALQSPDKPAAAMPAPILAQLASTDFLLTSVQNFAGILSSAAEKTLAEWAQVASSLRSCPSTAAASVRALMQQRNPLLTLFMLCASSLEYDLSTNWAQQNVSLVALGEQIQDCFDQPSFADTVRYLQQIWRNLAKVKVVVPHKTLAQYPNEYYDGWSDFMRLLQGVLTTLDIDLRACGPYPTVTDARPAFSFNSCRRWRNDVNECRKRSDKCEYVDYADNDDEVGIDTACNTRDGWIDETMSGLYQWICYGAQEPLVDVRAKLMKINLWEVFEAMCFSTRTVPSIVRSQLMDVLLLLANALTLDKKTGTICDDKAWVSDAKVRNPFVLVCAATYSFLKTFPKNVAENDVNRFTAVMLSTSWKDAAAKGIADPATLTAAFRPDQAVGVVSSWIKLVYLVLSPESARARIEATGFDPRVPAWQSLIDAWTRKRDSDYDDLAFRIAQNAARLG
jgi:hypothetical protein